MKSLLPSLCLSAAVFSTVAATAPVHALDQMLNPGLLNPGLVDTRVPLPPRTPFQLKAELTVQSRIISAAGGHFVEVLVRNEGHVPSGIFTTRVSIKHRFQSTFTVHDVKMLISPGRDRLFYLPALAPGGPQNIQSRAVADVENDVPEYHEENNRSLINIAP